MSVINYRKTEEIFNVNGLLNSSNGICRVVKELTMYAVNFSNLLYYVP